MVGRAFIGQKRQVQFTVRTGQQALFAYMDAMVKVILSTLPDTDEDARTAAVVRGKLRYSRRLKSVGAKMAATLRRRHRSWWTAYRSEGVGPMIYYSPRRRRKTFTRFAVREPGQFYPRTCNL
jgi:hypothetical protein